MISPLSSAHGNFIISLQLIHTVKRINDNSNSKLLRLFTIHTVTVNCDWLKTSHGIVSYHRLDDCPGTSGINTHMNVSLVVL